MHESFAQWFQKHRHAGPIPSKEQLGNFLAPHFKRGNSSGLPTYTKVNGQNVWRFPALAECRRVFEKAAEFTPPWSPVEPQPVSFDPGTFKKEVVLMFDWVEGWITGGANRGYVYCLFPASTLSTQEKE